MLPLPSSDRCIRRVPRISFHDNMRKDDVKDHQPYRYLAVEQGLYFIDTGTCHSDDRTVRSDDPHRLHAARFPSYQDRHQQGLSHRLSAHPRTAQQPVSEGCLPVIVAVGTRYISYLLIGIRPLPEHEDRRIH